MGGDDLYPNLETIRMLLSHYILEQPLDPFLWGFPFSYTLTNFSPRGITLDNLPRFFRLFSFTVMY